MNQDTFNVCLQQIMYKIKKSNGYTIMDLKNTIHNYTGIEPYRLKVSKIDLQILGNKDEDDYEVEEILQSQLFKRPVRSIRLKIIPVCICVVHAMNALNMVFMPPPDYEGFSFLSPPSENKFMLVLGLEQTLLDAKTKINGKVHFSARPHLHMFLKSVYRFFNIGIWSNTPMESIEQKCVKLGLDEIPDFKLTFLADKKAIPILKRPRNYPIIVKPLQVICNHLKSYNLKNTIICDVQQTSFTCNPENGVLLKKYFHRNKSTDDELLLLNDYLMYLAIFSDAFCMEDHNVWKQTQASLSSDSP